MTRLLTRVARQLLPRVLGTHDKQRLSILIFHRVLPRHDPMRPGEPTIGEFDWQMRLLRQHFNPLPLVDAVERLQSGTLPVNAICVTFDDGYADNEVYAMPVLKKYGIPATVFVSTGFLNGGRMWNDSIIEVLRNYEHPSLDLSELDLGCYCLESSAQRVEAIGSIILKMRHLDPGVRQTLTAEIEKRGSKLPDDLMLTDEQIRSLARNSISIGAHTVNHPILASISGESARREVLDSKMYLEHLLQEPVDVFAYPNGRPNLDYGTEHRDLVSNLGFKAAVSTHWGVGTPKSDRLQLPRFTPWDRRELKFAIRLMASYRWIDPLIASGR